MEKKKVKRKKKNCWVFFKWQNFWNVQKSEKTFKKKKKKGLDLAF